MRQSSGESVLCASSARSNAAIWSAGAIPKNPTDVSEAARPPAAEDERQVVARVQRYVWQRGDERGFLGRPDRRLGRADGTGEAGGCLLASAPPEPQLERADAGPETPSPPLSHAGEGGAAGQRIVVRSERRGQ